MSRRTARSVGGQTHPAAGDKAMISQRTGTPPSSEFLRRLPRPSRVDSASWHRLRCRRTSGSMAMVEGRRSRAFAGTEFGLSVSPGQFRPIGAGPARPGTPADPRTSSRMHGVIHDKTPSGVARGRSPASSPVHTRRDPRSRRSPRESGNKTRTARRQRTRREPTCSRPSHE